jgi:hypothetical protein
VTGISTAELNSVWRRHLSQGVRNSSGDLAILTAIRRASSLVDRSRRREAAGGLSKFVGSFANRVLVCIREIE